MLVSRGSPGVSRRWGELSEGGSDENAMAPEAFEGPLAGPDALRSFSASTRDVCRQPTRRYTPVRHPLSYNRDKEWR